MDSASPKKKADDVTDAQMDMESCGMRRWRIDKHSVEFIHIPNNYLAGAQNLDSAVDIIDLNTSPPMVGEEEDQPMEILNDYPGGLSRPVNAVDVIDMTDSPMATEEGVGSLVKTALTNFVQHVAAIHDEGSPMQFDDFPEVPTMLDYLMGGSGDARPPPQGSQMASFHTRNSKIPGR